jgi:hypothetical protein
LWLARGFVARLASEVTLGSAVLFPQVQTTCEIVYSPVNLPSYFVRILKDNPVSIGH